ncbi:MAG: nucleoside-diphosphate kinase [Dehalococcoidia bacterium]|nr:nucleoside-diphosphate kinase [Dehalococcoidia bacterium]
MDRTLVLLKPDAIQRGLVGNIIGRLEARGLKIVGLRFLQVDRPLAERHYAVHQARPFYAGLVDFITSGPIVALALEGRNAVDAVRATMGATDAAKAAPGTIRGDLGIDLGHNLIHGSDSAETAVNELKLFFPEGLVDYARALDGWITEA